MNPEYSLAAQHVAGDLMCQMSDHLNDPHSVEHWQEWQQLVAEDRSGIRSIQQVITDQITNAL